MTINEMFDELENKVRDTYIVTLKYKYEFDEKYTIENQILVYDSVVDEYAWQNDWNEGQTDVEVLGYMFLSDVDTTKILTSQDCVSREAVLEIQAKYAEHIGATKFWQMRDDIRALPSVTSQQKNEDMGEVSDGYHTFNQLYHQRAILFATIVNQNKDRAWKSYKHEDGKYCFDKDGEWFIVGIDTPKGSYTYHYSKEYWDYFDCEELECGKPWDGHTEEDVTRLLSLEQESIAWIVGKDNCQVAVRNMPVDMMQKICAIIGEEEQQLCEDMRDATEEERKSTKDYIDSISKPTGLQFDDVYEELDFVRPHKKISVNLQLCEDVLQIKINKEKLKQILLNNIQKPQPKTGHWINHREHCENLGVMPSGLGAYNWCSNCDCGIDVMEFHKNHYNYCPNCGCRMVEPQESEG